MTQCNTKTRLDFQSQLPVDVEFCADDISSDGGAVLLGLAEERLSLCSALARFVPDERDPSRVVHKRSAQLKQRVFQLALGYDDQNDSDYLRGDAVLKTVCGSAPDGRELCAQSSMSRLENAVDAEALEAMQLYLIVDWVRSLDDERTEITLDIDSSCIEGHGRQQKLAFNSHHGCRMLHPLLVFDDETGQLITAILRGGGAGDARDAAGWVRQIVSAIKLLHRRDCSIVVRADAGFARPPIYRCLERLDRAFGGVGYLIGISRNRVLEKRIVRALEVANQRQADEGGVRRVFVDVDYAAGSWNTTRRIVAKAEVGYFGENPRFVVTNLVDFSPRLLYERGYCGRGRCEQGIGEFKGAIGGDRIGCSRFEANGFRVVMAVAAYRLLSEIRRCIASSSNDEKSHDPGSRHRLRWLARATFETIRLRLLKVAFIVRQSVRRIYMQGARNFPMADIFHHVALAMA